MKYSKEDIRFVDSQNLYDVMLAYGLRPMVTTANTLRYVCPFHPDHDPSLSIERGKSIHQHSNKDYAVGAFRCMGCGKAGYGAIQLWSALRGQTDPASMPALIAELCARLNLVLPSGDYENDSLKHCTWKDIPVSKEIQFTHGLWNEQYLAALGCRTWNRTRKKIATEDGEQLTVWESQTDKDGRVITECSWDQKAPDGTKVPLDTDLLTKLFNIYPVESYITEESLRGDEHVSYKIEFGSGYPVFEFRYQDSNGWWSKKYEPMWRPHIRPDGKQSVNYKFTWWYQGGKKKNREVEMSTRLYGDCDVMDALAGCVPSTSCPLHPVEQIEKQNEQGETEIICKFRRVIICSGARDAMNVWYHSDAHVVYPHSENSEITEQSIRQLRRIAKEIYVLYDTDTTGVRNANQLCLRFQDLHLVQLPSREMGMVKSTRSGKPCKDVSEYFENWDAIKTNFPHPDDYRKCSATTDFRHRVLSAKTMQFMLSELHIKPKTKEPFYKYTIDVDSMILFLGARGLKRAPKNYITPYVLVYNNIVEAISEKAVISTAKMLMKSYAQTREDWTPEMSNAISTSNRITQEQMKELPEASLDYQAWGEDFDYFYYQNGALFVNKEVIRLVPYSALPYAVDHESILPMDYIPWKGAWPMEISENPDVDAMQIRHESVMRSATYTERIQENKQFSQWMKVNRFIMKLNRPMNDMPEVFQFIFDTCRIKHYKEKNGLPLTDYDRQFQVAHLVNKMGGLGYYLSRMRTPAHQQMVSAVDYFRQHSDLNCGRSGKSTFEYLIRFARNILEVSGKNFKVDADSLAKNFAKFKLYTHGGIFIDDIRRDLNSEVMFNLTQRLNIKSVYRDEFTLEPSESPKLFITQNKRFNMDDPSTLGRLYPMYFSDYYHEQTQSGTDRTVSPLTKFGHLILESPTPKQLEQIKNTDRERYERILREQSFTQNFLARCLQFWFNHQEVIMPPIDDDTDEHIMDIDNVFVEWADKFFENPDHYGVLLPVPEMIYSYLCYKGNPDAKPGKVKFIENMATRIKDNSREFRNSLTVYCNLRRITNTPLHLIRSKTDREKGVPRCKHWVTRFDDKGRETYPHSHVLSANGSGVDRTVPCRIFFRPTDTIYSTWEEIPPIPNTEPDENWLMIEAD